MRFFLDNNLSPKFARALSVLAEPQGNEIIHLSDKFDRDVPDTVWISSLSKECDWIIVSADPRITRNKANKAAWKESGLTAFFFGPGWASQSFWTQAHDIVRWWPVIVLEARRTQPGTGYLIPKKGKLLQILYEPS